MIGAILFGLALTACTSSTPTGSASPKASPSATSRAISDADWKAFWDSQGATTTPPRDVADIHKYVKTLPAAQNLTSGKVSDADVKKWVDGNYASSAIEEWAGEHLQTDLLSHGLLSRPEAYQNVFFGDLTAIRKVVAAGGTGSVADPYGSTIAAGVVTIPADVKESIKADTHYDKNAPLTDYGMLLRIQGPIAVKALLPDGSRPVVASQGNVAFEILVSGEFQDNPTAGPLWVGSSLYYCEQVGEIRGVCGQLR